MSNYLGRKRGQEREEAGEEVKQRVSDRLKLLREKKGKKW